MEENILVVMPVNDGQKARLLEAAPAGTQFAYRSHADVQAEDAATATVIIGNIRPQLLEKAKALRWLQLNSAGADAYTKPGILPDGCRLTTAVGAYGLAVSEHMLAMLFCMNRRLPEYVRNQEHALWRPEGTVKSIEGSTILILGAGNIGCDFARKVKALGAYTIGTRRAGAAKPDCLDELSTLAELDTLLPRADVVAICLPATEETRGLFGAERLAKMKEDAILINVGRGALVDTDALLAALEAHTISGACLDVTDPEPLPADHPLWRCGNVFITPHVAGQFFLPETVNRIIAVASENLRRYCSGEALKNEVRLP